MKPSPTAITLFVVLSAAGAFGADKDSKKFDGPGRGFTLSYPARWNIVESPPEPTVMLLTPTKPIRGRAPDGAPTMYVKREPGARGALDQLEEKAVAAIKEKSPDAQVLSSDDARLGGEKARRVMIKARDRLGGSEVQSALVLCVHGDTAYTLGCTAQADDFDRIAADLDKVLASFRFTDAASKGKGKDEKPGDKKPKDGEKLPF